MRGAIGLAQGDLLSVVQQADGIAVTEDRHGAGRERREEIGDEDDWPIVQAADVNVRIALAADETVALQKAQINMDKSSKDYLLLQLTQVYRYTDRRTYPLSSYSWCPWSLL